MKDEKPNYAERSLIVHEQLRGKLGVTSKMPITSQDDLSVAYTPGVAAPCLAIKDDPSMVRELTMKRNTVAVVSDGSAVLGLGNIGAEASIPVMEGKCVLFKEYAGIDAWPICVNTQSNEDIIKLVRQIVPVFGGINLEDISAPRCFEIEAALQDLGVPVFHDDQHGTAIVLLAALINASKVVGKEMKDLNVVINGAGAAGTAIARLLRCQGHECSTCVTVKDVIVCDSKGAIHEGREDLNDQKKKLLGYTNYSNKAGTLVDSIKGADVFVGVSTGDILTAEDIKTMADDAIVFAMANPTPEIMPEEAVLGGAAVVGTGRSDFPNQVNNVLVFPGIFRGALDANAKQITPEMKLAAAEALASVVKEPNANRVLPSPLDPSVAPIVAKAVRRMATAAEALAEK